jgi:hypothetical protein
MIEAQKVKEDRRRSHTRAGKEKPKAERKSGSFLSVCDTWLTMCRDCYQGAKVGCMMSVHYGAIRQFLLYLYHFHVFRLAMARLYAQSSYITYAPSTCAIVAALCLKSPTLIACNKKLRTPRVSSDVVQYLGELGLDKASSRSSCASESGRRWSIWLASRLVP